MSLQMWLMIVVIGFVLLIFIIVVVIISVILGSIFEQQFDDKVKGYVVIICDWVVEGVVFLDVMVENILYWFDFVFGLLLLVGSFVVGLIGVVFDDFCGVLSSMWQFLMFEQLRQFYVIVVFGMFVIVLFDGFGFYCVVGIIVSNGVVVIMGFFCDEIQNQFMQLFIVILLVMVGGLILFVFMIVIMI